MSVNDSQDAQGDERVDGAEDPRQLPDNVAGRLYSLIASLGSAPRSPGTLNGAQVCRMLGVDPDDRQELRNYGLRYLAMVADIRNAVDRLPQRRRREPYLRYLPTFEDFFLSLCFKEKPVRYVTFPDKNAMYGLEMCAEALYEYEIGEPSIPKEEASDLLRLVQDLMAAIRNDGDLTPQAKTYLIDRLLEIERAILHVEVVGMEGLQAAVDRFVGASLAHPEAQKPRVVEWMAKLWRTAHGFAIGTKAIADAGNAVISLTKSITCEQ